MLGKHMNASLGPQQEGKMGQYEWFGGCREWATLTTATKFLDDASMSGLDAIDAVIGRLHSCGSNAAVQTKNSSWKIY